MDALYIAAAVPAFFALIGLELWINVRRGNPAYRFADSISNLGCGVGSLIVGIALKGTELALLTWFYHHLRLFDLPGDEVWVWALALLGVDLCYYWLHRSCHRINTLWSGHVAHHQSEEYNLSVALRQSWVIPFFGWIFYLPLVIVGVPPLLVIGMRTLDTLYQFWIHTEAVRRLGPLEWVMNTPSHHRVHHGVNPAYIDRNYAGIFIIWDRLFGTFVPEGEEVVYGLVEPLRSFNPLFANVQRFGKMATMSRRTRRMRDKLRVWIAGPEWVPDDLGGVLAVPSITRKEQRKYDVRGVPRGLVAFVTANFAAVVVVTTALLVVQDTLGFGEVALLGGSILGAVTAWGGWLEGKVWAPWLDAGRWLLGIGAVAMLSERGPWGWAPLALTAVAGGLSMVWGLRYRTAAITVVPNPEMA